jgi:hypothetical protein
LFGFPGYKPANQRNCCNLWRYLSDGAGPAQQTHGKQEESANKAKHSVNGDARDAKRQSQQPNDGIKHQSQQRYGPAQNEQNAPQKESGHGNLSLVIFLQANSEQRSSNKYCLFTASYEDEVRKVSFTA